MATPAEEMPSDPALVVIERPGEASFDDWLARGARRRSEVNDRFPAPRIQAALGRPVAAPVNGVSVAPPRREAWSLRQHLSVADARYVVVARRLEAALVTTGLRVAAAPGL